MRQTFVTCSTTLSRQSRSARSLLRARRRARRACSCATSWTCRSQLSISPCRRLLERRHDAAAPEVAADHDLLDAQHLDGVLQHREAVEIGVHDDVRDVAVHEHLARIGARDLVGRHAAVRAADPEVARRLLRLQPAEEAGVAARAPRRPRAVAVEEIVERHRPRLRAGLGDAAGLQARQGVSARLLVAIVVVLRGRLPVERARAGRAVRARVRRAQPERVRVCRPPRPRARRRCGGGDVRSPWRRFDAVPPDAEPWLYGVARRVLAGQWRSQSRQSALVSRLIDIDARWRRKRRCRITRELYERARPAERERPRSPAADLLGGPRARARGGCARRSAAMPFNQRVHRARKRLRALCQEAQATP